MNRLFKILLPIINVVLVLVLALCTGMAVTLTVLAPSVLFVLCYDFLLIFYMENHEDYILLDFQTMLMILAAIMLPYVGLYLGIEWLTAILLLASAVVTVNCINLNFSILCNMGLLIYGFLYFGAFTRQCFLYFIIAALLSMLTESMKQKSALFYSLEIGAVVYFILLIVKSEFTIANIFSAWNIIYLAFILGMLVLAYFLKFKYSASNELTLATDRYLDRMQESRTAGHTIEWQNASVSGNVVVSASELDAMPLSEGLPKETEKQAEASEAAKASPSEKEIRLQSELEALRAENSSIKARIESLFNRSTSTVDDLVSEESPYMTYMHEKNNHLYIHSQGVAVLAQEAADLINCDAAIAKALGLYHEAGRLYSRDLEDTLFNTYRMPKYLIKSIIQIKDKSNNSPLSREAGIVILCDDIFTTVLYLKSKGTSDVSIERIINNTFKVRKEQGMLRLAGFSNEEVQLLKMYFNDKRDFYDTIV